MSEHLICLCSNPFELPKFLLRLCVLPRQFLFTFFFFVKQTDFLVLLVFCFTLYLFQFSMFTRQQKLFSLNKSRLKLKYLFLKSGTEPSRSDSPLFMRGSYVLRCIGWCALGMAEAVTRVPQVYLGNRDLLDGSYVCPNHKQELSSVYQFIDVLYNLHWVLSSSDDDFIKSDSLSDYYECIHCLHCTVQRLKYLSYLGNYWLLPDLGNDWLLPCECRYWPYTSVSSVGLLTQVCSRQRHGTLGPCTGRQNVLVSLFISHSHTVLNITFFFVN